MADGLLSLIVDETDFLTEVNFSDGVINFSESMDLACSESERYSSLSFSLIDSSKSRIVFSISSIRTVV